MEHTELPLEVHPCNPGDIWQARYVITHEDETICAMVSTDDKAKADEIVRACNAHDDLLAACEKAQFVYDYAICRTPTGPERNKLTEQNILRMAAIAKAKE